MTNTVPFEHVRGRAQGTQVAEWPARSAQRCGSGVPSSALESQLEVLRIDKRSFKSPELRLIVFATSRKKIANSSPGFNRTNHLRLAGALLS